MKRIRSKQEIEAAKERNKRGAQTRLAKPKKEKKPHHNLKHDWPFIKSLYMAGMDKGQILSLPECEGLSDGYLSRKMYSEKWPEERRSLQRKTTAILGSSLQDRRAAAIESHYNFMLKEAADEREIIARRIKTTSMADQKERIELLTKFEAVVRKTLGLDDTPLTDANKNSYNFLIHFHSAGAGRIASEGPSATITLPENKNDCTGNLGDSRTMPVLELQAVGAERAEEGAKEGLERLSSAINLSAEEILKSYREKYTKKPGPE